MLRDCTVQAVLPSTDLPRARIFYGETLGLPVAFETPGGIMYSCGDGSRFVVAPSPNTARAGNTQMSWEVEDVASEVRDLKSRGIVFEEYDFPTLKTIDSVAQVAAGRAAWFKDPDGNVLGMIQFS